jgi:hypothetical protein
MIIIFKNFIVHLLCCILCLNSHSNMPYISALHRNKSTTIYQGRFYIWLSSAWSLFYYPFPGVGKMQTLLSPTPAGPMEQRSHSSVKTASSLIQLSMETVHSYPPLRETTTHSVAHHSIISPH